MNKIVAFIFFMLVFASCKKDVENSFISTPDEPVLPLSDWEISDGLSDVNTNFRSAFVKDDLLYVISNDSYLVLNKNNKVQKKVNFNKSVDFSTFYTRWSNEFIVVLDRQRIIIKHITTGAEKYIEKGSYTDMNGAKLMLSKYNNLYFNSDFESQEDTANHAFHLRVANNSIILDTLSDLALSQYNSTGTRYQLFYDNDLNGYSLYDDLNKTYNPISLSGIPFLPIQNLGQQSVLVAHDRNDDYMKINYIENGQVANTVAVGNPTEYSNWMQIFYVTRNLIFFTPTNQAVIYSFDLITQEFTYYPNDIPNEYVRQFIEYNDRLYLISTAGILSKPFE
jgi:hypothetical protein